MKNKENLKSKLLTPEQADTVKQMIVSSMRDVYVNAGSLPGDGFEHISGIIADKIIKNVQMALLQENTFKKVVEKSVKRTQSKSQARRVKITKNGRK